MVTWLQDHIIEINWDDGIVQDILDCRRKGNSWLPYDDLIAEVLLHVVVNLEREEFDDKYIKIENKLFETNANQIQGCEISFLPIITNNPSTCI